jgi:hypothetical protein
MLGRTGIPRPLTNPGQPHAHLDPTAIKSVTVNTQRNTQKPAKAQFARFVVARARHFFAKSSANLGKPHRSTHLES